MTNYFIDEALHKVLNVKNSIRGDVIFSTFLKTIDHSQSLSTCDDTLQSTLTWNLDRVVVNGDGNCLFTSVANSLIAHIQSGQVDGQLTLARIGLHEYDFHGPSSCVEGFAKCCGR